MHRRHLLQHLGRASAATLAAGLLTPGAQARTQPPGAVADAADAARQRLYTPFQGVNDDTGDRDATATLHGRWPAELRGRFYRNGPALFERGGQRYHHWFDGDGMVQQFTLGDGTVRHRGRLVRTTKLLAERQAGRFLVPALGTHIDGGQPIGGPDAMNTANTNALEHAGRVLAMWEGGSAWGLSPQDLATQGPVTWRPDLAQVPFSAHPKLDRDGHLWNIGTFGRRLVLWHIDPQGRLVSAQATQLPVVPGMVHDMAVTPRHIVVPLPPVAFDLTQRPADGRRRFPMRPGEPLRVLVMDKADISRQQLFELPPEMVFHVGNAHETRDGELVLSYIGSPDAGFLDEGAVALLAGRPFEGSASRPRLLRMHLATGRAQVQDLPAAPGDVEFPRVHPQQIGQPARWLLTGAVGSHDAQRRGTGLLHGLALIDTHTGRTQGHDYGAHIVAEEHVWVPKPGKTGELDAWLLGTSFDARRQATVLNLLDAAHLADGPIAQAVLPYALPLGFHGNFTAG